MAVDATLSDGTVADGTLVTGVDDVDVGAGDDCCATTPAECHVVSRDKFEISAWKNSNRSRVNYSIGNHS